MSIGRRAPEPRLAELTVDQERRFLPVEADSLRALLDGALDAVICIDSEGIVIGFNRAAQEMFGYPGNEALEKPMAELFIPPSLRERHRQAFARVIGTGESPLAGKRLEMTAIWWTDTGTPASKLRASLLVAHPRDGLIRTRKSPNGVRSGGARLADEAGRYYFFQPLKRIADGAGRYYFFQPLKRIADGADIPQIDK